MSRSKKTKRVDPAQRPTPRRHISPLRRATKRSHKRAEPADSGSPKQTGKRRRQGRALRQVQCACDAGVEPLAEQGEMALSLPDRPRSPSQLQPASLGLQVANPFMACQVQAVLALRLVGWTAGEEPLLHWR